MIGMPEVLGFVLADHRESLAAAQAHRMQAQRKLAHIGQHVVERELAPDAAVLVPLRDPIGIGAGICCTLFHFSGGFCMNRPNAAMRRA